VRYRRRRSRGVRSSQRPWDRWRRRRRAAPRHGDARADVAGRPTRPRTVRYRKVAPERARLIPDDVGFDADNAALAGALGVVSDRIGHILREPRKWSEAFVLVPPRGSFARREQGQQVHVAERWPDSHDEGSRRRGRAARRNEACPMPRDRRRSRHRFGPLAGCDAPLPRHESAAEPGAVPAVVRFCVSRTGCCERPLRTPRVARHEDHMTAVRRTHLVQVRVDPRTHRDWLVAARAERRTLSELVREAVRAQLQRRAAATGDR
jgi:hypothetical protein